MMMITITIGAAKYSLFESQSVHIHADNASMSHDSGLQSASVRRRRRRRRRRGMPTGARVINPHDDADTDSSQQQQ